MLLPQQFVHSFRGGGDTTFRVAAPIATSDDNVYIAWWTNKTGNNEVMFKASTDNGKTFGGKINLSNSSNANSLAAQIAASGDHVYVTWWERNQTSNEPVLRISTDNGKTFGPIIMLSSNFSSLYLFLRLVYYGKGFSYRHDLKNFYVLLYSVHFILSIIHDG
jgi:hypothetical protein